MRAYRLWEPFSDKGPLKWCALRTRIRSTQHAARKLCLSVVCSRLAASFDHWGRSGTDIKTMMRSTGEGRSSSEGFSSLSCLSLFLSLFFRSFCSWPQISVGKDVRVQLDIRWPGPGPWALRR